MKELREAWIARKLKVVYKRALELALAYQKWVLGNHDRFVCGRLGDILSFGS